MSPAVESTTTPASGGGILAAQPTLASMHSYNALGSCSSGFQMCFKTEKCWDADVPHAEEVSRTADCWWLTIVLIFFGFILIVLSELYGDSALRVFCCCDGRKGFFGRGGKSAIVTIKELWRFLRKHAGAIQKEKKTTKQERKSVLGGLLPMPTSPFTETVRTEDNFCRCHEDQNLEIPSSYGSEYKPASVQDSILPVRGFFKPTSGESDWNIARSRPAMAVFVGSWGVALLCSASSTVLWLALSYENTCIIQDENISNNDVEDGPIYIFITEASRTFVAVIQGYVYFPITLLAGYIFFIASRWRDWMVNCHNLQSHIHDIGVICGGSFKSPPTVKQRTQLFKIYRLLNAAHALCYKSVSESLCSMHIDDFCDELGLLTPDELDLVYPYPSKTRDAVLTMLTSEFTTLFQAENFSAIAQYEIIHSITSVRAQMSRHHDMFVRDNPNFYVKLLLLVVNTLLFFTIFTYPFTLLLRTPSTFTFLPCFQPATLVGVFLVVFSYRSAFAMINRLRNPFSWTKDRIKVDMLLASTDMCLFTVLRVGFKNQEERDAPQGPKEEAASSSVRRMVIDNDENDNNEVRNSFNIEGPRALSSKSGLSRSRRPNKLKRQMGWLGFGRGRHRRRRVMKKRHTAFDRAMLDPKGEFIMEPEECREA